MPREPQGLRLKVDSAECWVALADYLASILKAVEAKDWSCAGGSGLVHDGPRITKLRDEQQLAWRGGSSRERGWGGQFKRSCAYCYPSTGPSSGTDQGSNPTLAGRVCASLTRISTGPGRFRSDMAGLRLLVEQQGGTAHLNSF
nr:uncharacterized protein CTRU02_02505 [Colletotrichum truncatum]KAF6798531.1 hypothetical protein CTRU02_02505 [Colletotrichum truncatum]